MDISFRKVSYYYKDIKNKRIGALLDINLDISKNNEFIAICGKTGSGKSTLIQHLNALLLPTSGSISVFNETLPPKKNAKINHLRRKVGLVFQFPEYQLFEETVIKDIMFGPTNFKETKAQAQELAEKAAQAVGLDESIYSCSPFQLSGGQMRKVAIAGVLAMNPDVLVLDEPTRGLDPKSRLEVLEIFKKINEEEKKTIIMVTHDMEIVANYAQRVIVLNDGKIVFDGDKHHLFSSPQFMDFHLQLPRAQRLMKEISKELGVKEKNVLNEAELFAYLKEVFYE